MSDMPKTTASKKYYLLPIFLGLLGAVIMYYAVRDKDPKMAKRALLILEIMGTVVVVGIIFIFIIPEF